MHPFTAPFSDFFGVVDPPEVDDQSKKNEEKIYELYLIMWKLCFYMRYLPVSRRPVCRENVVSDGCDSCVDSIATSSWPGNQELLTLHPSQKKIVFTEKKHSKDCGLQPPLAFQPRNCNPHAAAERQPLMVASDMPTAMPNSRALPTLEIGVFSKKEWLSQSVDEIWWC